MMDQLWIPAIAAFAVALAASVLFRRRRQALVEIDRAIVALGEGRGTKSVPTRIGGALGRLARRVDEVNSSLGQRIEDLEGDRRQLGAVLEGMIEGVIAVDPRRRLVFANEAATRLLGLETGAVGRRVAELVRSPAIQEAIEAAFAWPGPDRIEVRLDGPLAAPRVLNVQGSPLPGDPTPGAVLVFHDVTEMRRLERVRQDFIANASHELKTPLASIKAYTEVLLDGALVDPEVNVEFLRRIDEQADRLDALIADMLRLAQLDAGQEAFRHAPTVLAPVVRGSFGAQRARAAAKGLRFALDISPDSDTAIVVADPEAIRQVLDNLIDNAIKYTPASGRVEVRQRVEGGWTILEVEDSGVGIPREAISRIFERFYRVDKARSVVGTGLGLAIVKHVVGALGGDVAVSSRLGVGSTFIVRLPRHERS
jgi:two-component system phosphate regulon sensor histidine kinase PhoR